MANVLVVVLTSAVVAALISSLVAVVNGQLQRQHELALKRAEEDRQLRDLKRERLWAGLRAIAEVAIGLQEANVDLMRVPAHLAVARKRGDDLYALVEGHRADIVLSSREGRDLLLEVVGALRRYQSLCDSWDSHLAMAQAQGSEDPEVREHTRFIDREHDLVHRSAAAVLDQAQAMIENLELPAYPPSGSGRLAYWFRQAVVNRLASLWPWDSSDRMADQEPSHQPPGSPTA